MFVGRNDGRLTALDKANGRQLWEFETDAGVHAPATTFEHRGRQYVVVHAGGSFFPGTKHGDGLWLFSLDGQLKIDPSAVVRERFDRRRAGRSAHGRGD